MDKKIDNIRITAADGITPNTVSANEFIRNMNIWLEPYIDRLNAPEVETDLEVFFDKFGLQHIVINKINDFDLRETFVKIINQHITRI